MAVAAKRRRLHELDLAAGANERVAHLARQRRAEEAVVLGVDPEHGQPRALAEPAHRFDQPLLAADFVI